jgi:microcystin-dependent protein
MLKRSYSAFALLFFTATAFAVDAVIPNDLLKFGKAANTSADKTLEFNKNSATNPKIRWYATGSKFELYDTAWKDILNESSVDSSTIEWNEAGPHVRVKDAGITNAKLRTSAATSVIGRSANSTGTVADIAATADGQVLKRTGAALSFGQITNAEITTNTISNANLRQSAAYSVIGNSTSATANVADISAASDNQVLRRSGTTIGFGAVALNQANAVTGSLPIANGGTGAATQQAAINALTGTQVSGKYLRSDGTNATLASIQAADVPTLNQDTTGVAANVTGVVAIANGGTGQNAADTAFSALCPTGIILPFAGVTAPTGFLLANGQAVSRTTYAALFAVIGTTYGPGDGSTTFNVPNTQGVFLRGAGTQTINNASTGNIAITYSGTRGTTQGDQFQGHFHNFTSYNGGLYGNSGSPGTYNNINASNLGTFDVTSPKSDGVNGTPRTGSETRPANITVTYIIKT